MVNLLRAQAYRLVRAPYLWGLMAVMAACALLATASALEAWRAGGPALPGAGEGFWAERAAGRTVYAPDIEVYLGLAWVPEWTALLASLLAAAFFGDDVAGRTLRSLAAGQGFRWRYAVVAAVLVGAVAVALLLAASAGVLAATLVAPEAAVSFDIAGHGVGRTLRWALEVVLIAGGYGMLATTVEVAAGSRGAGLLAALALASGGIESALLAGVGAVDPATAVAAGQVLPAGQLLGPLAEAVTPTAADLAPMALFAAAATALCVLALSRRDL